MTDEALGQAVSEIEDRFILQAVDGAQKKKRKWGKKILVLSAALIGLQSLLAYHTGYRFRYMVGAYTAELTSFVTPEGYKAARSSLSFDWDAEKPYRVENDQIYFTHDGSDQNITEFCSANDCFLYNHVNFWGNGYIIVIGGTPDNVGDRITFFESGRLTASVTSTKADLEYDEYFTQTVFHGHQWDAAINYEIEIRDDWYRLYYSDEDKAKVESQKPYDPYVITVKKA